MDTTTETNGSLNKEEIPPKLAACVDELLKHSTDPHLLINAISSRLHHKTRTEDTEKAPRVDVGSKTLLAVVEYLSDGGGSKHLQGVFIETKREIESKTPDGASIIRGLMRLYRTLAQINPRWVKFER